jgi:hypothetical protein
MTISINEKQPGNSAIVGCAYVFADEIDSENKIGKMWVGVSLISGHDWKPIYFTPGSALLTHDESIPFSGKMIESKFEMKVPGGSADMAAVLAVICSRTVVLKLTFGNGDDIICGGKTQKLRLVNAGSMGTQKGNVLTFTHLSKNGFKYLD